MASQVFYRKWRPQTLAEVVGQEPITQTLRHALSSGRISHAYLFCGPRGTGKTSTGRILAKAVNCLTNGKGEPCNSCLTCQAITEGRSLDVIEVDAASNRGIDEIRNLRERVNYAPNQARYKVYIIDEAHMLTKEASNALLKTLEEPPAHAIFILATTEIHKVLPTIISRCQHFDFRRLGQADVVAKLASICQAEDIRIDEAALQLVARAAAGSLRDAENLLEQLAIYYGADIALAQVQATLGMTGDKRGRELVKHIINNDLAAGMAVISSASNDGHDLRQFHREVVEYLRGLLMVKTGSEQTLDFSAEEKAELKELAAKASLSRILPVVKVFGQLELGFHDYSTLPLELALVDSVTVAEDKAPAAAEAPEATKTAGMAASARAVPAKPAPPAPRVAETAKPARPKTGLPVTPAGSASPAADATPPKAATPAKAPAGEKAAAPAADNELTQLKQNWKQIIDQAPEETRRTSALAILRSAGVRPVSVEADTIVLAFRYPLHRQNMEKPENQKAITRILSSFLGRDCQVRCINEPEEDNHLVKAAFKMGAEIIDVEEK